MSAIADRRSDVGGPRVWPLLPGLSAIVSSSAPRAGRARFRREATRPMADKRRKRLMPWMLISLAQFTSATFPSAASLA